MNALNELINLPEISGAIESLVGLDCLLDHHFLHITLSHAHKLLTCNVCISDSSFLLAPAIA